MDGRTPRLTPPPTLNHTPPTPHPPTVFFTEFFVRIPPATFPLQVCRAAFDAVGAQASAYSACAARQLATCHADLDFATEQERARAAAAEAANILTLDAAEVGRTRWGLWLAQDGRQSS